MLTIGSLFSGIGGLELGLERAGVGRVVWQCEIDPFARRVLAQHWPDAQRFEDVSTLVDPPKVEVICGGFPCQDISWAGLGAGMDGARSGLWREYVRLIRRVRPRYVVVENVAALLARGMGRVLGDLADLGYDAEWSGLSACSVGAPHMRRRVFILAYPHGEHGEEGVWGAAASELRQVWGRDGTTSASAGWGARLAHPSALYGGADGVPDRVDRVRALGNAVVPQVAEVIGLAIVAAERARARGAA